MTSLRGPRVAGPMAPDLPVRVHRGARTLRRRHRHSAERDQARESRRPAVNDSADRRILAQEDPLARCFGAQLEAWRLRMEAALAARLPKPTSVPARLHEAMRYSVLGGGKRIRPALLFATARAVGLTEDEVEAAACAIELVHVYSLVHDDLPAMDNDDLRRGRPTCHKAYDEATALLVGDALQPLAFQLLARDPKLPASPAIRLRLIDMLAQAIGTFGMAGGQAIDLAVQGTRLDIGQVEDMHARKTGAVIRASVLMAAECAPPLESESLRRADALCHRGRPGISDPRRPAGCHRRCCDAGQGHRCGQRAGKTHASGHHRHHGVAAAGPAPAQSSDPGTGAIRRTR